jgi:hypothetical protein
MNGRADKFDIPFAAECLEGGPMAVMQRGRSGK